MRDQHGLVSVGTPQQRALLALFVLNANEVVSRDRIIDELWGADPPTSAPKLVQTYVSRLRKALEAEPIRGGEVLVTQAPGYRLRVGPDQLDFRRFERLAEEGRVALSGGRPGEAAEQFREALALWRGPALGDFTFERFAEAEIGRLEELRLSVLEDRIQADLALGRGDLAGELEALIARHPLRERLRNLLMLALYRSGRQSEALDVYRETRRKLVEEVGVEPGPELRQLERAILAQDPALDRRPVEEAASERSSVAFVGRERELGELVSALDDALAGGGRLVMLVGEPGIGKSRLADELIGVARARGARVLVGRCWEAGGAPAYWPWVQSLRAYIAEAEPEEIREQLADGAPDLAQLLPELRELLPDLPEPALEPEGARFRLFEAVNAFLRRATRARSLVLVLDDLHSADEPSLLLLRFVARELALKKLLIVCALRDVAPTMRDPLAATVAELVRERGVTQIPLRGLSHTDIAEYIPVSTGVEPAPGLVEAVQAETEGNPFFVAETVRLLADEGRIGDTEVPLQIPPGVRAVIDQRVSRLSERCRRLLTLASVMGREFGLDSLARFSNVRSDELIDSLDEALAEQILGQVPGSPGRLRFGHALIRDTLYEELTTPARRMQLHRGAAEALVAAHADDLGVHLTEIAHHYVAAAPVGVAGKAVDYARRAGDRAASLLAYEEAARLYEMGLSLVDEPTGRCDLLLALGDAGARAGDTPAAKRAFREAAELAEERGLSERLARAALGYAGRIIWERQQDDEYLVPLLERALATLGDDDSALRVRLLARLAGGPLRSIRFPSERRFALSREAVEIARRLDDPATLAYALGAYIPAIESPANTIETLELSTELLEVATATGDKERVLEAHEHRLERFFELGEMGKAQTELEAMAKLADELRQPAQQWLVVVCRARLALHEGRFEEADGLIEHGRELGEQALSWNAGVAFRVQSYMHRREQGRLDEALELVTHSAREYPDYELWECALASVAAALGMEAEAKRAFEALAADDFADLPFDQNAWPVGMGLLAETAGSLGDTSRASVLYELLLPYAGRVAVIYPEISTGSVSRYLGILAATVARWADSERHFEAALEANERIGARPWLAHTREDYARMLGARGKRGDRERGRELAASALKGYRTLGMSSFAAEAAELKRALTATPRR